MNSRSRPFGRRTAAGVASVTVLLAALDAYAVVTILVDIMRDLRIPIQSPERATPVITAFLLGYIAAMPLLGQLSDRIGRLRVLQGCVVLFACGSVLSAVAQSLPLLVSGRLIQGAAGGALLPVSFAIVSDLWDEETRPLPLGVLGASQELGSVLGPLYGAGLAALAGWRSVFWINLPLAVITLVAVQRTIPSGRTNRSVRVDWVGGLLLALSLGALIIGLYNPDPAASILPAWGVPFIGAAAAGFAGFLWWENSSSSRLIDLSTVRRGAFSCAVGASFLSGVALMATLVNIPLLAQTLLDRDSLGAALTLSRFLAALAAGALVGGVLTRRLGERRVAVAGLLLAAAAYWMVSRWPFDLLAATYTVGAVEFSRMHSDLVLAGTGLGLIVAPLASTALRSSDPGQHGAISASVVVARMMGMLVGIAALGAAGVHRFQQLTRDLVPPLPLEMEPGEFQEQLLAYEEAIQRALHTEYGEIFAITSVVCLVAAGVAFGLGGGFATQAETSVEGIQGS